MSIRPAPRRLKDLRDTFARQLLTAGIPIGYIARQLGQRDVTTTAMHYAKWCESDGIYREPMRLRKGEVPADLLARLDGEAWDSEEGRSQPTKRSQGGWLRLGRHT